MASPPMPFFKLPSVALEAVIQEWDVDRIIDIAMLSDTFHGNLKRFRYNCDKFTWNISKIPSLKIVNKNATVLIFFKNMDDQTYTPVRKINGTYHFIDAISEKVNLIGEHSHTWCFHVDEDTLEGKMKMMEEVTEFLMTILRVNHFNLVSALETPSIKDLFIWKYTKTFSIIDVSNGTRSLLCSPEDLIFLLEEVTAETRRLNINVPKFQYEKPIQGKNLYIGRVNWATTASFMGSEVVNIRMMGKRHIDFNEIVKNWVNGGCRNLETVRSDFYGRTMDQTLSGLEKRDSVFTPVDLQRRCCGGFPENYYDIRRNVDGRLCTIFAKENFEFEMNVWHPKHYLFLQPETRNKLTEKYGIRL